MTSSALGLFGQYSDVLESEERSYYTHLFSDVEPSSEETVIRHFARSPDSSVVNRTTIPITKTLKLPSCSARRLITFSGRGGPRNKITTVVSKTRTSKKNLRRTYSFPLSVCGTCDVPSDDEQQGHDIIDDCYPGQKIILKRKESKQPPDTAALIPSSDQGVVVHQRGGAAGGQQDQPPLFGEFMKKREMVMRRKSKRDFDAVLEQLVRKSVLKELAEKEKNKHVQLSRKKFELVLKELRSLQRRRLLQRRDELPYDAEREKTAANSSSSTNSDPDGSSTISGGKNSTPITVYFLNGDAISLSVPCSSTTVSELKDIIMMSHYGRRLENPELVVGETCLENASSITDADLGDGRETNRIAKYGDDFIYFIVARRFSKFHPDREIFLSAETLREQISLLKKGEWARNKDLRMQNQGWAKDVKKIRDRNRNNRELSFNRKT